MIRSYCGQLWTRTIGIRQYMPPLIFKRVTLLIHFFFFFLLSRFFYLFSLIFNTLSIIFIIFSLYLSSSSSSLSLYQIHSILTQTISLLLKYTYRRRIGFESTRDNALCIMYMIFKIKKRVTHDTALSMIRHLL